MKQKKIYAINSFAQSNSSLIKNKTLKRLSAEQIQEKKWINSSRLHNKQAIKTLLGLVSSPVFSSNTLLHYNTKSVVYSYKKVNNLYPLLTKTEYLLKSLFRSMFSLISKPIYLINHDRVIIQLFVFLSPKLDKFLDTTTRSLRDIVSIPPVSCNSIKELPLANLSKQKMGRYALGRKGLIIALSKVPFSVRARLIKKLKRIKSLRPRIADILKYQIKYNNASFAPAFEYNKQVNEIIRAAAKVACQPLGALLSSSYSIKKEAVASLEVPSFLCLPSVGKKQEGSWNSTAQTKRVSSTPQPEHSHSTISSFGSNFINNLEKLSIIWGQIFNKKVEFEIIKAQLPFQDSNILAQILGYNANKYKFRRMLKILIPRAVIKNPSKVWSEKNTSNAVCLAKQANQEGIACVRTSISVPPVLPVEGEVAMLVQYNDCLLKGSEADKTQGYSKFASTKEITSQLAVKLASIAQAAKGPMAPAFVPGMNGKVDANPLSVKNSKMLSSVADQPSSYLPPFFYSKTALATYLSDVKENLSLLGSDTIQITPDSSGDIKKGGLSVNSSDKSYIECGESQLTLPLQNKGIGAARQKMQRSLNLPSYLSGMNIKLAGRLMTQSMRPRFTVQSFQEGSLARVKVHFIEKSRFTGKNKRGAFSFTVTISHVFN